MDADSPIMIIGDKSKAQISRFLPKNIALTFNQIGKDIPTFADAAGVADLIIKSDVKYDSIVIVYNKFVSSISYEPAMFEVQNETSLKESRKLALCMALPLDVDVSLQPVSRHTRWKTMSLRTSLNLDLRTLSMPLS